MGAHLTPCGRICWQEDSLKSTAAAAAAPQEAKAIQPTPQVASVPALWEASRPKGTPIQDEGFICMGGKAPRCPPPLKSTNSGPITLAVLQGNWLGSSGVHIFVFGTDVNLNGVPLRAHKVQLNDDGTVRSIGNLWQLQGWTASGLEFRASSTQENMESARSEVWSRREISADNWAEKMRLLGYAGSSASPLTRGIEGCLPGTSGIEPGEGSTRKKDMEDVLLLTGLVMQWREPETCKVQSRQVIPDFTNRAQTGLGVELMHYIATSMQQKGFKKRNGRDGHDIPVLVREAIGSEAIEEALSTWKARVTEEDGFPPVRVSDGEEIFTSLGNGHFFQALNLFACNWPAINRTDRYAVGQDKQLAEALEEGVQSIILRAETPRPVRAKIAELLNAKREFQWTLNSDGTVDTSRMDENTSYCSQFEWLSKGMDAEQVNCLVRTHLGIRDSRRIQG